MKALVLAGGRGSRLNGVAANVNKCMLPFLGKALIEYSLENAVAAGVDSIVTVVGHRGVEIINRFGTEYRGTTIQYVIQNNPAGVVHAIECARDAVGDSDVMLFLADEILTTPHHEEMVRRFHEQDLFGICGVVHVEDLVQISKTYALIGDDRTSRIYRLIEKPRVPINNIMGTGNCILRSGIFDYLERTPINVQRRERELPDLIQCAIDEGHLVEYFDIGTGYLNINAPDDIAEFERLYPPAVIT